MARHPAGGATLSCPALHVVLITHSTCSSGVRGATGCLLTHGPSVGEHSLSDCWSSVCCEWWAPLLLAYIFDPVGLDESSTSLGGGLALCATLSDGRRGWVGFES